MRSYVHVITFIILNFTADCGAREHVVYKSIGENTHLTLKEPWTLTTVKWRKDNELIVTVENKEPAIRHPEKYHIHANNSLFIINLTVNDSGLYKAQTGQWETEIILYRLIVQEVVSKPVIDHQMNTSSVCHILVKCSADGDSVTYDCDHQHCTRTNATSTKVNISINYTDNGVLECTASNHVSIKRTTILIRNICSDGQSVPTTSINYTSVFIILTSCIVFGVLMISIVKCFYNARKKKQNEEPSLEDIYVNTSKSGEPLRRDFRRR